MLRNSKKEKIRMNNLLLTAKETTHKLSIVSIALLLLMVMNSTNIQAAELTKDEQKCLETAIEKINQSEASKSLLKAWHESGESCKERDSKIFSEYLSYTMANIKINPCLSSRMINDFASVPAIQMQMLDTVQKKLESEACPQ
ncbi:MAG: hypothetical protein D3908_01880 [Candidatus Electrothrix sp. AUS4]|nr:hypothetical protein [Candidatus Electrothrix sp. AUS4]